MRYKRWAAGTLLALGACYGGKVFIERPWNARDSTQAAPQIELGEPDVPPDKLNPQTRNTPPHLSVAWRGNRSVPERNDDHQTPLVDMSESVEFDPTQP